MKFNILKLKNKTIYTMCAFVTISAVGLTGCVNQNNDVKKQDVNVETSKSKNVDEVKNNEVNENKNNEKKDKVNHKKFTNESKEKCNVKFIKKKIIDDPKFNTKLKINKGNTMSACIEGLGPDAEEEGVGYIYIKDLKTKEKYAFKIVQKQPNNTPKYIEWFDDDNLMVTIGSSHGTVSKGGNLYKININTGLTTEIYNTRDKKKQVVSVKRNNNKLKLEIVVFDDEFLESYKEEKNIIIK